MTIRHDGEAVGGDDNEDLTTPFMKEFLDEDIAIDSMSAKPEETLSMLEERLNTACAAAAEVIDARLDRTPGEG